MSRATAIGPIADDREVAGRTEGVPHEPGAVEGRGARRAEDIAGAEVVHGGLDHGARSRRGAGRERCRHRSLRRGRHAWRPRRLATRLSGDRAGDDLPGGGDRDRPPTVALPDSLHPAGSLFQRADARRIGGAIWARATDAGRRRRRRRRRPRRGREMRDGLRVCDKERRGRFHVHRRSTGLGATGRGIGDSRRLHGALRCQADAQEDGHRECRAERGRHAEGFSCFNALASILLWARASGVKRHPGRVRHAT